jgi:hypothetical protein
MDDCLLWDGVLKVAKVADLGYFFPPLRQCIKFDKNNLGYILGDFFHKLIWSPWLRISFYCCQPTCVLVQHAIHYLGATLNGTGLLLWCWTENRPMCLFSSFVHKSLLQWCEGKVQGCQMVYSHTRNSNLGTFWRAFEWKLFVYLVFENFVIIWYMYFVVIWYILWSCGIFCGHLVYISPFRYVEQRKIWQLYKSSKRAQSM